MAKKVMKPDDGADDGWMEFNPGGTQMKKGVFDLCMHSSRNILGLLLATALGRLGSEPLLLLLSAEGDLTETFLGPGSLAAFRS